MNAPGLPKLSNAERLVLVVLTANILGGSLIISLVHLLGYRFEAKPSMEIFSFLGVGSWLVLFAITFVGSIVHAPMARNALACLALCSVAGYVALLTSPVYPR